ncbi:MULTISPECIES: bifunctional protein-serine/threonine kinase/phosphatase [Methylorubrum]|uniref:bifunctional protein-serine/threonine kinase/phosphatase n=1 Tax=Methylorubrum TaxID=2282523 RepID=UPI0020A12C86|nr:MULTISPECIES: bifunctional protein-serine/threonine kinase/phosphatase [Methylorubrum]MCP1550240.1 serine/threonine protein phosphatase PrpC/predicted Ser/Thr protein kinase [Methylorubrum zatmanii]MCP1553146.1 serine/threonine protein phosphatase PrpC/predicted Ser/Thr protein kinase [Methylorubrum extorquens]MCP1580542.1 serine/threonine protein phosphatase PrpC/predicted Ser/Thr protein kinase [Methylorubrum extorquens]
MTNDLKLTLGQHSEAGRKPSNQDFHGALVPGQPALGLKGAAIAIADGIGSSAVSHVASETAVKSFLTDYYDTPDTWSVKSAAQRVIAAANSWLYAETRRSRHEPDRGYVTTFSALILKGRTAHFFHVGDGRICRVAGRSLEQLTEDHRLVLSAEESYLGRALGAGARVEIDHASVPTEPGDVFLLTTDGVHEHVDPETIAGLIAQHAADLDIAAQKIVRHAYEAGSADNLTAQIVRIEAAPEDGPADLTGRVADLAPAPLLDPPTDFDGYRVLRTLHASHRSHVYLARDSETGEPVALKLPSTDARDDPAQLRRLVMEEWIARRIDNPHVLKAQPQARRRSHLYTAMEYVEGRTLAQWMRDNPAPDLEIVRGLVEQIARGLQAFHRREMVHQDLRPQNVLIDAAGTARIIDFGATRVAGVAELAPEEPVLGTQQYSAPEYLAGHPGTQAADVFSLGIIAYQMLTGQLPYGAAAARASTEARARRLRYVPLSAVRPGLPVWVDGALRKAVHPNPALRYEALSAFTYDLRHPNPSLAGMRRSALLERNPVLFWKLVSLGLALALLALLATWSRT